jgi:hypothetical protein
MKINSASIVVKTAYPQVQLTQNGQYLPIVATNGYHTTGLQLQQAAIYDPSLLQHVNATAQTTPTNSMMPPHQRTDRLTVNHLNSSYINC